MEIMRTSLKTQGILFLSLLFSGVASPYNFECDSSCRLPYCNCFRESIPGNIDVRNTPQMILVTFTGTMTETIRNKLTALIPSSAKNPNGCPLAITIFHEHEFEDEDEKANDNNGNKKDEDDDVAPIDPCPLHEAYLRGHEVAFVSSDPSPKILKDLARIYFLPADEIAGARHENLDPHGDAYFTELTNAAVTYDASMVYENKDRHIWPFTLNKNIKSTGDGGNSTEAGDFRCAEEVMTNDCPAAPHAMWEIPVDSLYSSKLDIYCDYLDKCASGFRTADEVYELLAENLVTRINSRNRAPMMINLKRKSLDNSATYDAVFKFVADLTSSDDDYVWFATLQDALKWVRSPSTVAKSYSLFSCNDRRVKSINCTLLKENPALGKMIDLFDVKTLWIYQLVFFIFVYIYLVFREKQHPD